MPEFVPVPEKTFIIYSHEDEREVAQLEKFLDPLVEDGTIAIWRDRKIEIGTDWDKAIKKELEAADIILIMVSADALASKYIKSTEFEISLRRQAAHEAIVVPIIVHPCMWERTKLGKIQALPLDGRPISEWDNQRTAFNSIANGLAKKVDQLRADRQAHKVAISRELEETDRIKAKTAAAKLRTAELEHLANEAEAEEERQKAAQRKLDEIAARKKREAEEKAEAERKRREKDPFHDQMILIEGGTFQMGDLFGEGYGSEKPVHEVTLSNYYLQKTAVSQAYWVKIMGSNPSHFKGDDLPVDNVSWEDAQTFIQKLNDLSGQKYRLPTEAEWEFAARERGKKIRFGNGKDIIDPAEINFDAGKDYKQPYSVVGEYRQKTVPVGSLSKNALGLFNMSGNVWEWCADWYDSYPSSSQTNPTGPSSGSSRVIRGGGWDFNPRLCRAANRNNYSPSFRNYFLGFRLARSF